MSARSEKRMRRNNPVVICDASALINLALIDQLYWLEAMRGIVCIPPGVYDEVVRRGAGKVGAEAVQTSKPKFLKFQKKFDHSCA
jgi:predicted nucleic acid-binding protein